MKKVYKVLTLLFFITIFTLIFAIKNGFYILGLHHPKQKIFESLDYNLPPVDIKGAFYINMDTSIERRNNFLARYNGPMPLTRISGVKAEKGTI
jgi:hypothetical protein